MPTPPSALDTIVALFTPLPTNEDGSTPDSLLDLLNWTHRIAAKVRKSYGFAPGSQEADDLAAAAALSLAANAAKFDLSKVPEDGDMRGAFQGWVRREIQTQCVREAERLRAGGTINTCRPGNRPHVAALGDAAANLASRNEASEDGGPISREPVSRIQINGVVFALPFERLLRPLTGAELDSLRADIQANGIQQPVAVATLPELGSAVIDGGHRAKFAAELGLGVPLTDFGEISFAYARDRALALNVERRHLTDAELKTLRAGRVARVVEARGAGRSIRVIAAAEGVDSKTIQRDLAEAEPSGVAPATPDIDGDPPRDIKPGRVTGADGKSYPATRAAQSASRPAGAPAEPQPDTPTAGTPTEREGPLALAGAAAAALDTAFKRLAELLRTAMREQVISIAEEMDIPFADVRPGRERWPALTAVADVRGVLARLA